MPMAGDNLIMESGPSYYQIQDMQKQLSDLTKKMDTLLFFLHALFGQDENVTKPI